MTNRKDFRICFGTFIILALCIILCIFPNATITQHWYCKRTSDHSQPQLDADMEWIRQFNGIYIDQNHHSKDQEQIIYLTFDAGYENGNIAKILDVMHNQNVTGAFFVLGNLIKRNPELVKRMSDEGHLVCNHTYTHKNITLMTTQEIVTEIKDLEKAYFDLTGKQMSKYFRPPEGTFDQQSLETVSNLGYKTVFWSFAYADWDNNKQMSAKTAKKKIMDNLHNGEIILLHPTSTTNAQILDEIISELKSLGYRFGTLDELDFSAS